MATNHKNPMNMTKSEILNYISSGRYISNTMKKQLQEILEKNKQNNNRFSILDDSDTINTDKNQNDIKNDDLSITLEKTDTTNKPLNYGLLIDQISDKNDNTQSKPLFDNDNLLLSFNDILKMYECFAIYRIRLQYIIINRKINILNTLEKINPIKGKIFKKKFEFDKLVKQESELKICITIYMELQSIKNIFDKENLPTYLLWYSDKSIKENMLNKLKTYHRRYINIEKLFVNTFNKYIDTIKECTNFIKKVIEDTDVITISISENDKMQKLISSLIDKLINDYDPHMNCNYFVTITSSTDGPIIPEGLSTSIYLSCHEEINLSTKNKIIDNDILYYMTEEDIQKIFEKRKKIYDDTYFIHLYPKKHKQQIICINYYLEDEIPRAKISVKIPDLPKDTKFLSSILRNYDLDKRMDTPILVPIFRKDKQWLNKHTLNDSYKITMEQYNELDESWKEHYSFNDISKNIFTIDYLFNELLEFDKDNIFIRPEMINSFRKLAIVTSNIIEK